MGYYSKIQTNDLAIHATTWMNLKGTKKKKNVQYQKVTYYTVPFIQHSWNGKMEHFENDKLLEKKTY